MGVGEHVAPGLENVPPTSVDVKLTGAAGGLGVPTSVSLTVAVQVVGASWIVGGDEQEMEVLVVRALTVSVVEPSLVAWVASAPYVAVRVGLPSAAAV